jgi:flagellar hook protein FlgE
MLTSFFTALSGINANSQAIDVIGNNLANINTTAYKGSRADFAELVGSVSYAANGNPIQTGLGTVSAGVSPLYTQGSIQATGRSTDVAISGNGFFVLSTGTGYAYTRAGNFSFNDTGELVNSDGFTVAGYMASGGVINSNASLSPITIQGSRTLPPKATTALGITANLDSQAANGTSFASSAVQVFDSLGLAHTVTFTFTKTGAMTWSWNSSIPATDTGGAATDPAVPIGSGTFTFNSAGALTNVTANPSLTIAGLASGAADMSIEFQVLDANGNARFTGNSGASAVSSVTQDGYASSTLRDVAIDSSGVISGTYDNGEVIPVAQLALANFNNPEGLLKFIGNSFVQGASSGEPSVGTPRTGGRGMVDGASLEMSNVDIAEQLTSLIVAERGYQANSRVITTTDQLYQDAISMKQ